MAIFKCKMCGGQIEVSESISTCTCDYCGTEQTLPKVIDNEKLVNLHNRAVTLRMKCEFDKAIVTYENIISENPNDAEAHWGLLLCKYGIEYVDDPKTGKKVPTCHRTQIKSIFEDIDYKTAIENTDVVSRRLYEEEAEYIESVQKKIFFQISFFSSYVCFVPLLLYRNHEELLVVLHSLLEFLLLYNYILHHKNKRLSDFHHLRYKTLRNLYQMFHYDR